VSERKERSFSCCLSHGYPLVLSLLACIPRRAASPPVQGRTCSLSLCAPARHRRPGPRLSAGPLPKAAPALPPRAAPPRAAPSSRARALTAERPRRRVRVATRRRGNPPGRRLPPPRTGEALAPAPSHARPRPCMDRSDGTDASTLAAWWARPPPAANNSQCRRGRGVLAGVRRL